MTSATVKLWGHTVGAVSWDEDASLAHFEYEPNFIRSGVQVAPLTMPLAAGSHTFPALPRDTFRGLPGLLADSLPDDFGNAVINAWLARQGRSSDSFNPVERLCHTGSRGMGALEYEPLMGPSVGESKLVDVAALVALAGKVLAEREAAQGHLDPTLEGESLQDILRVGGSAGGARAKAIIAWNEKTNQIRAGDIHAGEGFTYWLLKLDGVAGNKDKEKADPKGYGLVEYAYYLMARAAGITMQESRLHREGGRSHFMTRRFDRTGAGGKVHLQSLCALRHLDYRQAGAG